MNSSEEETETKPAETLEWDIELELQLFHMISKYKPAGLKKNFHMIAIWDKLQHCTTKKISGQDIWKHLETLYDIQMLNDTELVPFPNDKIIPFTLCESEYGSLIKQKYKELIGEDCSDEARTPSPKPSATPRRSSSRGTASKEAKATRKDSTSGLLATKTRKESASSHASTDTPSIKSDYDRRRDSRDSNASGPRDASTSRKSKDKTPKTKISSLTNEEGNRRGRRRANTSTPPVPGSGPSAAKRRRT